jgi:hypoxanthine-guanine phosphoribosyltransferase
MKKTLILDHADIAQKTRRMAYQIVEDNYDEKEIIIIGIRTGGYEYAKLLKKEIEGISDPARRRCGKYRQNDLLCTQAYHGIFSQESTGSSARRQAA